MINFNIKNYPDLEVKEENLKNYIPKLFGFKIFGKKGSKYYNGK
jgi:hypothetical protein